MSAHPSPLDDEGLDAATVDALLSAPADAAPDASTSARVRSRLLRRIAQEQQHLTVQAAAGSWKDFSPGVQIKVLHRSGELMSYLLRFAPGAFVGAHRHRRDESCVVLDGTLRIGDDLVLPAGGFHLAAAGTVHARIGSEEGATIYLHGSAPETADLV